MKTEDQVRSSAETILGFNDGESGVEQGTEQITTFNHLGFKGKNDKPDGWYLPHDKSKVAIVLETKAEGIDIDKQPCADELLKNVAIVCGQYVRVVGILYNGASIRVWKNTEEVSATVSPVLERKDYYTGLFASAPINKQKIYTVTKRINDSLEFDFKMTDLTDRMIFTACALVAQRYCPMPGLASQKGNGYTLVHAWINHNLAVAIGSGASGVSAPAGKLDILVQEFNKIAPSVTDNAVALDRIIDAVCDIADLINSASWNGEDVMAIFFNEFNRYRSKKKLGQVLTPDHVTSFMYRLIGVSKDDFVLDATCGTGAFLVKAMCNMMNEAGGYHSAKSAAIRTGQLFGIEMDRRVFALACANMLIHKDGKTNLEQLDSRLPAAADWIKDKGVTKVLMNPPYEQKNGCTDIIANVMDSVPTGTLCAFILPDKKLEKAHCFKLLKKHTLETIVKMPEDLFFGVGVTTSVFVFRTGTPQGDRDILGYYIEDDGLETVKNQGRQDVRNRWPAKEDYWIKAIQNGDDPDHGTKRIIHPTKSTLSYPTPEKPFEIFEEDFMKTMMDYELFQRGIDAKEFGENILKRILYSSDVVHNETAVTVRMEADALHAIAHTGGHHRIGTSAWGKFKIGKLFTAQTGDVDLQQFDIDGKGELFVNSGTGNLGVKGRTSKPARIFPANTITIDFFGNAYYRNEPYKMATHNHVFSLSGEIIRNEAVGTFLAIVLSCAVSFPYKDMGTWPKIAAQSVFLPVDAEGKPDFNYMETCILARRGLGAAKIDAFLAAM